MSESDIRDHSSTAPDNRGACHRARIRATVGSSGLRSLLRSGCLRYLFRRRGFHGAHVEIEQAFAFVALVLVLLPQLDDLLQDLYIKPLALGLREHFLLLLVQLGQFAVNVLDPLDERTDLAAGNGDVRHGASLFNEVVKMPANK